MGRYAAILYSQLSLHDCLLHGRSHCILTIAYLWLKAMEQWRS